MKVKKYDFFKTKYGEELLIDLIRLENLERYIAEGCPHYLTYYDITLISGGKGNISIDHYQYEILPGTILFSSPGEIRHWKVEEIPTGYVLIFEEEFLNHFLNDSQFINDLKYFCSGNPPQMMLSDIDMLYLTALMKNIEHEVDTFSQNDQYLLQALLYQTLVWLNRKYPVAVQSVANENNRYISQFSKVVNKEYQNHHSVSYYADYLNITSGHINDLCKMYLGINAKQYIQNRIILEAKRLLLYSDLQIEEIASQLGFDDAAYFSRRFRQITSITPLAFRKDKHP